MFKGMREEGKAELNRRDTEFTERSGGTQGRI